MEPDSVANPSLSANRSAEMTTTSRLRPAKGTGTALAATTTTLPGARNANAAIWARTEPQARHQLEVVARAIGSAKAAATTTSRSELSASDAMSHVGMLQASQVAAAEGSEVDVEVATEEDEVVVEVSVVTEAEVVVEVSEVTEGEAVAVEDSTNLSVASTAKTSRPATKRSSLTNKLLYSKISLNCRPLREL